MTDGPPGVAEQVTSTVAGWPGVETAPHRFGGIEFRLGRRELGHLHGDRLADIPFPRRVRDELIAGGRAEAHHILPLSGWISLPLRGPADVENAIELFRLSYDRAQQAQSRREQRLKDEQTPGTEPKV